MRPGIGPLALGTLAALVVVASCLIVGYALGLEHASTAPGGVKQLVLYLSFGLTGLNIAATGLIGLAVARHVIAEVKTNKSEMYALQDSLLKLVEYFTGKRYSSLDEAIGQLAEDQQPRGGIYGGRGFSSGR